MNVWIPLALISLVCFGLTGITQKISTNHISFSMSFIWFAIGIALVSCIVWLAVGSSMGVDAEGVALAAGGGLLNGLGALTSFVALEKGGKASIVIPIVNLYPLVTAGGACLFLGEALTRKQSLGLALALAAAALLSRESAESEEVAVPRNL